MSSNVIGNGKGTVEGEEETSLGLRLGSLDLGKGRGDGHSGPLFEGKVDQVVDIGQVLGDQVDTPETSVVVGRIEVLERVGEVVGGYNVGEFGAQQWGSTQSSVPVSKDARQDKEWPVVWAPPSDGLDGNGNVEIVHSVVSDSDLSTGEDGLFSRNTAEGDGVGGDGDRGKVFLGEFDELLVRDSTSSDEAHSVGSVVGFDVVGEVLSAHLSDVLLWTEDRVTQWLT